MRTVIAYYILLAAGVLWAGQGDESAMLQADRAFVQAEATADKAALEKLLDADFMRTDLNSQPSRAHQQVESKHYIYGEIGDVQENSGRLHVLRVWVKRPTGWKIVVYQEVLSLEAPPSFAPGAGKNCENPCRW